MGGELPEPSQVNLTGMGRLLPNAGDDKTKADVACTIPDNAEHKTAIVHSLMHQPMDPRVNQTALDVRFITNQEILK